MKIIIHGIPLPAINSHRRHFLSCFSSVIMNCVVSYECVHASAFSLSCLCAYPNLCTKKHTQAANARRREAFGIIPIHCPRAFDVRLN